MKQTFIMLGAEIFKAIINILPASCPLVQLKLMRAEGDY